MGADPKLSPASSRAFMNACVHKRVENEQIAPLWKRCQDGKICNITTAKKERRLGSEELSRFRFEAFMLRAVVAQKPRPAGSDRGACLERSRDGILHAWRASQRQIVIRSEVDPRTGLETAQTLVILQASSAVT